MGIYEDKIIVLEKNRAFVYKKFHEHIIAIESITEQIGYLKGKITERKKQINK